MADLVQVSQVEFYKQRLEVNMSAILQGADKAYLREYNESEDERRLDALQDSLGSVRQITKGGKYLGQDVIDIMIQIQTFAEKLGIDPKELDYAENQVREAQNNLESAIYGLEEPFTDMISTLQNRIDDARMDAEDEVDEGMYDQEAFDTIFKDRKDKGSMENPTKEKPRHTGMYIPPHDEKSVRDKRENDNIDEESKGLWANIHAKRKRGEKPAKPGDKAYPKTLDIDEEKQRLDPKCWDGYKKQGTKMKGDKRVNNCVKAESRIGSSLRMVAEEYEREMEEGNGRLRGIAAGALLIGSLMGLNNKMAQEVYDNSHQLQQLTQIYQIAQERGDEEKMKDVKRRISNHKTRLDLGKGDVDFDGRPGNDDIKDIDYLNEPK